MYTSLDAALGKGYGHLEKVQRRATKMIKECAEKTYEERNEIGGLPTLECRKTRADLIEVFKILKSYEGIEERFFRSIGAGNI